MVTKNLYLCLPRMEVKDLEPQALANLKALCATITAGGYETVYILNTPEHYIEEFLPKTIKVEYLQRDFNNETFEEFTKKIDGQFLLGVKEGSWNSNRLGKWLCMGNNDLQVNLMDPHFTERMEARFTLFENQYSK